MKTKRVKQAYNFTAVLEPDYESGGYTVTIPALPGCISEGNTFEEALRNIQEAAELYIETTNDKGLELPKEQEIVVTPVQVFA